MKLSRIVLAALSFFTVGGCAIAPPQPPLKTVGHVDLPRFMGDWYVIGTIPWFVERDNVGTMDVYALRPDGKIDIRYVFHKKSLDAPREEMRAVGTVVDRTSNATWGVQFIWPFKAPYLVVDLSSDYRYTVIGHPSRDLVWIMSRQPRMAASDYRSALDRLKAQGYDISRIVRVPQRP